MTRKWSLVLHLHQPPTQSLAVVKRAIKSSYLPLLEILSKHPNSGFTFNISSSLTLQIKHLGATVFFDKIKSLAQNGQIEILQSPFYHPLVPLTPASVILRQLEYHRDTIQYYYNTTSNEIIYPPELAINPDNLLQVTSNKQPILVDESSVKRNFSLGTISSPQVFDWQDRIIIASSRTITEILRAYPTHLSHQALMNFILQKTQANQTIISVSDGELFGHHYIERLNLLQNLLQDQQIQFIKLSQAINNSNPTKLKEGSLHASSWEAQTNGLEKSIPYPIWSHPNNHLQTEYLKLADLAFNALDQTPRPDPDHQLQYSSAEKHYDYGTSSCHLFWLSNWPWWHPGLVEKGARHLIQCVRTLPVSKTDKLHAESQYLSFLQKLWQYHWSEKPLKSYHRFDLAKKELSDKLKEILT